MNMTKRFSDVELVDEMTDDKQVNQKKKKNPGTYFKMEIVK